MIPNVVKGRGFRGLTNYLLVGRKNARILAGNMVGMDSRELAKEFGICRRLRPKVQNPVMHHTLSFADGEDPGDELLPRIAESYVQRLGLENHQWVTVVHRDKAHVHIHLAINRIGFQGQWWNATHDFERAQVIAAQVEVEFGLVQVPRIRLREAIQKSLKEHQITPPAVPLSPPVQEDVPKTVLGDLRMRLEGLPHGLPAPDWILAAKAAGVTLKPSIGGTKISGFTAALSGHRAVKLSDIHRSLSWPSLLKTGRVLYDPESHFEVIAYPHGKEPHHAQETPLSTPGTPAHGLDADTFLTPDGGMAYRWQPIQPGLVALEMGEGPGPGAPGSIGRAPQHRSALPPLEADRLPASESGTVGSPTGSGAGAGSSTGLLGDGSADLAASLAEDVDLGMPGNESGEHLLGGDSQFGPGNGSHRGHGVDADGSNARPERPPSPEAAVGGLPIAGGGSILRGGIPDGEGSGQSGAWSRHSGGLSLRGDARELIGAREDFSEVGLPERDLPASMGRAASLAIATEEGELIYPGEFGRKVRERQTLWVEAKRQELAPQQYRQAKALVASVSQYLEPARAVMQMLSLQAHSAKPSPDIMSSAHKSQEWFESNPADDVELVTPIPPKTEQERGPVSKPSKRIQARDASTLIGFKVDQEAGELPTGESTLRSDWAAALVIAKEVGRMLNPRDFQARVEARLRLWQEAEEGRLSASEYAALKTLRMMEATPSFTAPRPPGRRTAMGLLGWRGQEPKSTMLVGLLTDWRDQFGVEMAQPPDLHEAARLLLAHEAGQIMRPVAFAMRAELRESLWEEAEMIGLGPDAYRQVRDRVLQEPHATGFTRSALAELVGTASLSAERGNAPQPSRPTGLNETHTPEIGEMTPKVTSTKKPRIPR